MSWSHDGETCGIEHDYAGGVDQLARIFMLSAMGDSDDIRKFIVKLRKCIINIAPRAVYAVELRSELTHGLRPNTTMIEGSITMKW